jgi:hypothetical protein
MSKIITLTKGKFAIVDDEDFEELSKYKWFITKVYASRHSDGRIVYMHREIMHTSEGMETDHINGDVLDNRRSNLRICTRKENARNIKRISSNTSGYKGVHWDKVNKKWRAQIQVDEKMKHIGRFESLLDAINAYDRAAIKFFGEFASTNL